jgi:hypothetical protein
LAAFTHGPEQPEGIEFYERLLVIRPRDSRSLARRGTTSASQPTGQTKALEVGPQGREANPDDPDAAQLWDIWNTIAKDYRRACH